MRAVSNTSPIYNLAAIDQLHLLRDQFERVFIPTAVQEELLPIGDRPEGEILAPHESVQSECVPIRVPCQSECQVPRSAAIGQRPLAISGEADSIFYPAKRLSTLFSSM